MTLHLALKRKYFDAIKARTKVFEYRACNNYWKKRLFKMEYFTVGKIVLTLGYPKRDDTNRRIERPWKGYKVMTITHPEFGDKPVKVFAIRVN